MLNLFLKGCEGASDVCTQKNQSLTPRTVTFTQDFHWTTRKTESVWFVCLFAIIVFHHENLGSGVTTGAFTKVPLAKPVDGIHLRALYGAAFGHDDAGGIGIVFHNVVDHVRVCGSRFDTKDRQVRLNVIVVHDGIAFACH